jgi:hypothetical protein
MAALELRLSANPNETVTAEEIAAIAKDFDTIAVPLRAFVGE